MVGEASTDDDDDDDDDDDEGDEQADSTTACGREHGETRSLRAADCAVGQQQPAPAQDGLVSFPSSHLFCRRTTTTAVDADRLSRCSLSSSHAAAFFSARAPARGRAAAAAAAAPRRSPLLIHGAGLSPARSFSTSPAARAWSVPGLSWLGYGKSTSTGETTPTTTPSAELLDSHSGALAQAEPPSAPPAVELDSASEVLSNAATGASSSVADALYGNLDLSALSGWGLHPVMRLQSVLINMHEYLVSAALPTSIAPYGWLVAVPLFTLALRSLLVPFLVRQQQNVARMAVIQPKMLEGMTKVKDAKAKGDLMGMQTAQYEVNQRRQPTSQTRLLTTGSFACRSSSSCSSTR